MDTTTEIFYILANVAGVYVKEGTFFRDQGGLTEGWGKNWVKIRAKDLREARQQGIAMRRERFPDSHKTLDEK